MPACVGPISISSAVPGNRSFPAASAKTGTARMVHLSPLAVDVLRSVPPIANRHGLVFPSSRGTPLSAWTRLVAAVVQASGVLFTMQSLRVSFRTGLSRIGIDEDTAERCLGHQRPGLLGIYNHDLAEQRQRDAVTRWAEHIEEVAQDGR